MPRLITEETKEAIRSMSLKKLTQGEIAEKLGVSVSSVRRYQNYDSIPASNRYRGGMISSNYGDSMTDISIKPVEDAVPVYQKKESERHEYVAIADQTVTLTGNATNYIYTICSKKDHVTITTNNEQDLIIDLKSLVAFGNEILDVAERLEKIRNV